MIRPRKARQEQGYGFGHPHCQRYANESAGTTQQQRFGKQESGYAKSTGAERDAYAELAETPG